MPNVTGPSKRGRECPVTIEPLGSSMDHYLEFWLPPLVIFLFSSGFILLAGRILHAFGVPCGKGEPSAGPTAGPGDSLLNRFEELNAALHVHGIRITALPLLLYGAYLTYLYFFPEKSHWIGPAILVAGGVAFEIHWVTRLKEVRAAYRTVRLAYENKRFTGEALAPLMQDGYRVFHEVRFNDRAIDHVLVGPKGLFAIQTYTHSSPPSAEGAKNVVRYDGRTLLFGEENVHTVLETTEQMVEQLSEWLSEPLPEAIAVRPILAVPGWTVKRTSVDGMPVVNPKQLESLFRHIGSRPLEPATHKIVLERVLETYRYDVPSRETAGQPQAAPAAAEPC